MKVLLVNGSPHEKGTTYAALKIVADEIEKEGIATEIFWVGNKPIMGCHGCGKCSNDVKCCYTDDSVNQFIEKAWESDAFVFGTSIHFAGTTGFIKPFMDRALPIYCIF